MLIGMIAANSSLILAYSVAILFIANLTIIIPWFEPETYRTFRTGNLILFLLDPSKLKS